MSPVSRAALGRRHSRPAQLPVAVENDINLAAVGERCRESRVAWDSSSSRSVPASRRPHPSGRAPPRPPRRRRGVDLVAAGRTDEIDPCAAASPSSRHGSWPKRRRDDPSRRSTSAASSRPHEPATRSHRRWSRRGSADRAFTLHRSAAVTDIRASSSSAAASAPTQTSSSTRPGISSLAGFRTRLASRSRASRRRRSHRRTRRRAARRALQTPSNRVRA